MPLLSVRKLDQHTYLGLWDLREPAEELRNKLNQAAPKNLLQPVFTSESRQQQWLAARLLVYTLLPNLTTAPVLLCTDPLGKPFLQHTSFHVSISHTTSTVAVILSDLYEVGIDIEFIHPKVLRVKEKFLSPIELNEAQDSLVKTMVYWCTKETLYKLYSQKKLLFKEHLVVKPFTLENKGTLEASINTPEFKKNYLIYYETIKDCSLTYCFDKPTEDQN